MGLLLHLVLLEGGLLQDVLRLLGLQDDLLGLTRGDRGQQDLLQRTLDGRGGVQAGGLHRARGDQVGEAGLGGGGDLGHRGLARAGRQRLLRFKERRTGTWTSTLRKGDLKRSRTINASSRPPAR